MPVYLSDMKTINEVLKMTGHELLMDHARLDAKLDIAKCESAAWQRELIGLFNEFKDAHRIEDAQRVLDIMQAVRREILACIDQLEVSKK
jgi:hypothetical protein